jgi:hypothetical protein
MGKPWMRSGKGALPLEGARPQGDSARSHQEVSAVSLGVATALAGLGL